MMKYLELRVSVKGHVRFTVFYGQSLDIDTSETLLALAEFTPMRSEVQPPARSGFGLNGRDGCQRQATLLKPVFTALRYSASDIGGMRSRWQINRSEAKEALTDRLTE
jgi:hypothetical protein